VLEGSVANKAVFLVDFSELEQGPVGLADADVQGLIDHHRIGTLITRGPLDAWVRTVGCSATVLLDLMGYDNLNRAQARLLVGAIISDTFNFTSPTTTTADRAAVAALLPLAELDLASFAQTLLERRTQLGDSPLAELLVADEKEYVIASQRLYVSQICVMDPNELLSRQDELTQAMQARLEQDQLDGYVLMLTDLTKGNSQLHFASHGLLPNAVVDLTGAVSRKKEGLPWLTKHLS
jgi:manganese-dependent inorganic pyrophosphatase